MMFLTETIDLRNMYGWYHLDSIHAERGHYIKQSKGLYFIAEFAERIPRTVDPLHKRIVYIGAASVKFGTRLSRLRDRMFKGDGADDHSGADILRGLGIQHRKLFGAFVIGDFSETQLSVMEKIAILHFERKHGSTPIGITSPLH